MVKFSGALLGPPSDRSASGSKMVKRHEEGAPPAKQEQQEETFAPLDAEERSALESRLARRDNGAGRYATSRPASPTTVHSSWFQHRELTATGDGVVASPSWPPREEQARGRGTLGEMDSYDVPSSGYGRGWSARGYSSARQEAGLLTPNEFRALRASARRDAVLRAAKAEDDKKRERARRAAQQAAARQSAREAVDEARRDEARRAIRERELQSARQPSALLNAAGARTKASGQTPSRRRAGGGGQQSTRAKQQQQQQQQQQQHSGKLLTALSPELGRPLAPQATTPATTQAKHGPSKRKGKRVELAPNDIGPGWL